MTTRPSAPKLLFLSRAIALAQFGTLSMEDDVGKLVSAFATIEVDDNTASIAFTIEDAREI
ncbi:hypothetical protein QO005_003994 [Rhizobium paknamense]|uniref:Uncharacterized protein n=1 Tax=Rhizobium paknamense TaxID=1206817 RepID=A0ABU0IH92_9HYPH|nr:hypothetical protein [Rhizobium paknamense]